MGVDPASENKMYRDLDGPNSRQVGGAHYKNELQHWDFVEEWGLGYLECVATKYICRWRDKDGLKDLEKAAHYVDKLIELATHNGRKPRGVASHDACKQFAHLQGLDEKEFVVLANLCRWSTIGSLQLARRVILEIIEDEQMSRIECPGFISPTAMESPFGFEEDDDVA